MVEAWYLDFRDLVRWAGAAGWPGILGNMACPYNAKKYHRSRHDLSKGLNQAQRSNSCDRPRLWANVHPFAPASPALTCSSVTTYIHATLQGSPPSYAPSVANICTMDL